MTKYDFTKFPSYTNRIHPEVPLTLLYSAKAHSRGRLHMCRVRVDQFHILFGRGPRPEQHLEGTIYAWTLEDQEELVTGALEACRIVEDAAA